MELNFTKMHGLGNDFAVIDAFREPVPLNPEQIRRLADRRRGIGFDQLLMVEPPGSPEAEFRYRIYNADGGEVEHCGNGARCFARFVLDRGLTRSEVIPVETANGLIRLQVQADGQVSVDMGVPVLEPEQVPFLADARSDAYDLEVGATLYTLGVVSVGNPHAVLTVSELASVPLSKLGPLIEHHQRFPNRVNVGFMRVDGRDRISLRVWERGVGETQACGTGACAAVVVGRIDGRLDERVTVQLTGGDLIIEWPGPGRSLTMTGPASRVFEGTVQV